MINLSFTLIKYTEIKSYHNQMSLIRRIQSSSGNDGYKLGLTNNCKINSIKMFLIYYIKKFTQFMIIYYVYINKYYTHYHPF